MPSSSQGCHGRPSTRSPLARIGLALQGRSYVNLRDRKEIQDRPDTAADLRNLLMPPTGVTKPAAVTGSWPSWWTYEADAVDVMELLKFGLLAAHSQVAVSLPSASTGAQLQGVWETMTRPRPHGCPPAALRWPSRSVRQRSNTHSRTLAPSKDLGPAIAFYPPSALLSPAMYCAYQSGQFGSGCPVSASCLPCAASARRSASAKLATEP